MGKRRSISKHEPSLKTPFPGSNIGGYTSSLKTSSSKSHPRFKYYMGTDDIEDLVSFSKTPAGRMEKEENKRKKLSYI